MLEPGVLSFGLAGVGFLVLTLLLAVSWEGRSVGMRLVAACGLTSLWGLVYAAGVYRGGLPLPLLLPLETLHLGAWIYVLTGLAAAMGLGRTLVRGVHFGLAAWSCGILLNVFVPALFTSGMAQGQLLVYGGIGLSLAGLVLIEQVYRNSRDQSRHTLKFLAIALGVVFAYDLFVFAQAMLLRTIEVDSWNARGVVALLTVPMIAIAARRNPQWSLNVFVSRQVVFYTATFVAVGFYLLVMAFGGFLIAQFGGTWGRTVQLVFFAGAAMVLVTLMASNDVRRQLRVFLAKHFYRNKYDYRVEWLRFIQTLSGSADDARGGASPATGLATGETQSGAIRAIAQIVGSPGGVLFMRDEQGRHYVATSTWPAGRYQLARFAPLEAQGELVQFLRRRQWVVDVEEHRRTPDVYDNIGLPALFEPPGPHRIVLPLLVGQDLIGVLVLDQPPPPFRPNYEDRDLLKTVGRHVATHLAQHEADRKLAESRQFEAFHRLTAFVMHDLKNLAAQLSLIVANAEKHRRNPEFVDDAIRTVAHSTERMHRLIAQLQGREVQGQARQVSLADVVRRASERCALREPVPLVVVDDDASVSADPERLTATIEHLVRNAQDATPLDGQVQVRLGVEAAQAVLIIADTGSGMSEEFVQTRLFRPFDTTKGSKGMGIGAYQAREYVLSLGGAFSVKTAPGEGTTLEIRFPRATP